MILIAFLSCGLFVFGLLLESEARQENQDFCEKSIDD